MSVAGMVVAGSGMDGGASGRMLPIGLQSFEDLRRKNYLYVDKTAYMWHLANNAGKVFFMSRPRRFGKSLLTSTLEAYFRGRKDLFQGLAIESLEESKGGEAWAEYPVIRFDLSAGNWDNKGLRNTLSLALEDAERRYGVRKEEDPALGDLDLANRFRYDIGWLHEATGRQVVILVDEYDNPLLDATDNDDADAAARRLYKEFFSAAKSEDTHIRFAFFTGVTKFGGVTIFSGLNNLKDISLDDRFAGMCGITQGELEANLSPEVDAMARKNGMTREECLARLARMYDGYRFSADGPNVYNPFSLLNALDDMRFSGYWFATGTPSFLIPRLKASNITPEQIVDGEISMTAQDLMDYRDDNPSPIPLLYQAGYLTIDSYDPDFDSYTLRFPNDEVRGGFFNLLAKVAFSGKATGTASDLRSMVIALRRGDTEGFMARLTALFAAVPYPESPEAEHEWRNQVFIVFTLVGLYTKCEVHTSHGRADCIVETDRHVYVFEFKVDRPVDEALEQIEKNGYAVPYAADSRAVHKVGVSFSSRTRTISEWQEA